MVTAYPFLEEAESLRLLPGVKMKDQLLADIHELRISSVGNKKPDKNWKLRLFR